MRLKTPIQFVSPGCAYRAALLPPGLHPYATGWIQARDSSAVTYALFGIGPDQWRRHTHAIHAIKKSALLVVMGRQEVLRQVEFNSPRPSLSRIPRSRNRFGMNQRQRMQC